MALPAYLLTYLLTHLLVPEPVTARVPTHYLLTTYSPATHSPVYLHSYLIHYCPQDPRLVECLVSVAKHFGGPHYVEKQIEALDAAGFVPICKSVYCGVTGKTEVELHAAFASRGWASQQVVSIATLGASLGRRRMM